MRGIYVTIVLLNKEIRFSFREESTVIVKQYIKDFERLGFGIFVHFGAYSVIGKGEWAKWVHNIPWDEYMKAVGSFVPEHDWAKNLVLTAKKAGAKYITLTTRHHDGFSLYDTCGLNDYDAPHVSGRDLVREFVDACHSEGVIPFFYHTLLDWHEASYNTDFRAYLVYLRKSVELLCKNYGKIGGLWFDGMWDKPNENWEEDALYSMIRSYQPEAMIINNTGLSARGALGHIELDSVTFERGRPRPLNLADSPKYIASEMCQVFGSHWGYAEEDLNFKAPADMIRDLVLCRRYGSNLLMNLGPKGDGTLRDTDVATLFVMGKWLDYNGEMLSALPSGIPVKNHENDFVLEKDGCYYLVCMGIPMCADPNVALNGGDDFTERLSFPSPIASVSWLDNGKELAFYEEDGDTVIKTTPFEYGRDLVVRVAKITVKK